MQQKVRNYGDHMIYILYDSQYNTECKDKKPKDQLCNIIFNSQKFSNHVDKKKQIVKKEKKASDNTKKDIEI